METLTMWRTTNTELEAVAREGFTFAGVRYEPEAVFPHKTLGVIPLDLYGLWRAQLIRFTDKPAAIAVVNVSPGEAVDVRTPKQKRQRAAQRAE